LQRVELSPEEAGLCGCAQFLAVRRERQKLRRGKVVERSREYVYYVTSLTRAELDAEGLARAVRDHWGACENGAHYRRDVTLGEDASQISGRTGAHVMATLRNLVLGLFELQKERGQTQAGYLPQWRRQLTFAMALKLIKGG
jgi:predicted transposase YbfD/YdcC